MLGVTQDGQLYEGKTQQGDGLPALVREKRVFSEDLCESRGVRKCS